MIRTLALNKNKPMEKECIMLLDLCKSRLGCLLTTGCHFHQFFQAHRFIFQKENDFHQTGLCTQEGALTRQLIAGLPLLIHHQRSYSSSSRKICSSSLSSSYRKTRPASVVVQ